MLAAKPQRKARARQGAVSGLPFQSWLICVLAWRTALPVGPRL